MLFRKDFLEGISSGAVTLAFRRWRRPTVQAGGKLLTPVGQLSIPSVEPVSLNRISAADARRAGYESRKALLYELQSRPDGVIYRIELGPLQPDPRLALRENRSVSDAEFDVLRSRLSRMDESAAEGPWTLRALDVLRVHPGIRAGDLCALVGQAKEQFKLNVRKLKNLGLTESLGTGYRLSPRGEALLREKRFTTSRQTIRNAQVAEVFKNYPKHIRKRMTILRQLILDTATDTENAGTIEEALKWGEPSFVSKSGSTIRIDWKKSSPQQYAVYFNCNTKLIDTFKELYRDKFQFEGNRAIVFNKDDEVPIHELKHCISLALTYHKRKHLPMLGA